MRLRTWLAVIPLLLASACSGGSDGDDRGDDSPPATAEATTPEPQADEPESEEPGAESAIREAARAYSDAFLTGDADAAYELFSERCKARTDETEFASSVSVASGMYGDPLPFATFEADVSGDMARVTYTYADAPEINQDSEPWVNENGWRQDDC